jgi:hypothetical protein
MAMQEDNNDPKTSLSKVFFSAQCNLSNDLKPIDGISKMPILDKSHYGLEVRKVFPLILCNGRQHEITVLLKKVRNDVQPNFRLIDEEGNIIAKPMTEIEISSNCYQFCFDPIPHIGNFYLEILIEDEGSIVRAEQPVLMTVMEHNSTECFPCLNNSIRTSRKDSLSEGKRLELSRTSSIVSLNKTSVDVEKSKQVLVSSNSNVSTETDFSNDSTKTNVSTVSSKPNFSNVSTESNFSNETNVFGVSNIDDTFEIKSVEQGDWSMITQNSSDLSEILSDFGIEFKAPRDIDILPLETLQVLVKSNSGKQINDDPTKPTYYYVEESDLEPELRQEVQVGDNVEEEPKNVFKSSMPTTYVYTSEDGSEFETFERKQAADNCNANLTAVLAHFERIYKCNRPMGFVSNSTSHFDATLHDEDENTSMTEDPVVTNSYLTAEILALLEEKPLYCDSRLRHPTSSLFALDSKDCSEDEDEKEKDKPSTFSYQKIERDGNRLQRRYKSKFPFPKPNINWPEAAEVNPKFSFYVCLAVSFFVLSITLFFEKRF